MAPLVIQTRTRFISLYLVAALSAEAMKTR